MVIGNVFWTWEYVLILLFAFVTLVAIGGNCSRHNYGRRHKGRAAIVLAWAALGTFVFHHWWGC